MPEMPPAQASAITAEPWCDVLTLRRQQRFSSSTLSSSARNTSASKPSGHSTAARPRNCEIPPSVGKASTNSSIKAGSLSGQSPVRRTTVVAFSLAAQAGSAQYVFKSPRNTGKPALFCKSARVSSELY